MTIPLIFFDDISVISIYFSLIFTEILKSLIFTDISVISTDIINLVQNIQINI